ncbi:MAG: hypothetical protein KAI99_10175 [Cyclobacteriaceae bacterium]|nr:hypothetical protein [Cyclobacteriaceae bacterium]
MTKKVFINLLIGVFVFGLFSLVQAAKPQNSGSGKDVIAMSNGFPSGLHFNLNVHGKDDDYNCNQTIGGNSVFIPLYGQSEIQYVSNKKSKITQLMVIDSCSNDFLYPPDDNPIKVFLPQKVQPDELQAPIDPEGYYVFARILAKPNNGRNQECDGVNCSNIILYPNSVIEACNDSGVDSDTFGEYTDCNGDLALGLIVGNNLYIANPSEEQYVRFDPTSDGGKGKSKATDITRFFTYTGWVIDETLDITFDGIIDINDVPIADYDGDTIFDRDFDMDGDEDADDVEAWLTSLEGVYAWYYDTEWILNIADLVVTEQGLVNDGTKLLQIRFYPVSTTEYVVPQ